nr:MAG: tegument protein UL25 [Herpesviridae sp.]
MNRLNDADKVKQNSRHRSSYKETRPIFRPPFTFTGCERTYRDIILPPKYTQPRGLSSPIRMTNRDNFPTPRSTVRSTPRSNDRPRDFTEDDHDSEEFEILSQDFDAYIKQVRQEIISPASSPKHHEDATINESLHRTARQRKGSARSINDGSFNHLRENPLYEPWAGDCLASHSVNEPPRPPPIFNSSSPSHPSQKNGRSPLLPRNSEPHIYDVEYNRATYAPVKKPHRRVTKRQTITDTHFDDRYDDVGEAIYEDIDVTQRCLDPPQSPISTEETTSGWWLTTHAPPPPLPPRRPSRNAIYDRAKRPAEGVSFQFSKNLLSDYDNAFIRSCIHKAYQKDLIPVTECRPVTVYALDAMIDPILSEKAVKIAEAAKPTIKLIVMINYYYVGMAKLAEMKLLSGRLLSPSVIRELKHRLEPMVRIHGDHLALPLRLLGRTNITDDQHAYCLSGIDTISRETQSLQNETRNLKSRNGLFKTTRFTTTTGQALYARNLDILNCGPGYGDLKLLITDHAEVLTPHQLLDDVLFIISMGNMLFSFETNLQTLFEFIQHRLDELSELFYFVYLQLPHTENVYRQLANDIATQRRSADQKNFALRSIVCHLIELLRHALASGLFILPTYMRFIVKCAMVPNASLDRRLQIERAAMLLTDKHLFQPTVSEDVAKRIVARELCFTEIQGPTVCDQRIPVTTTTVDSTADLIVAAIRKTSTPASPPPRPRNPPKTR